MNTQFLTKICRLLRDWQKQTTQISKEKYNTTRLILKPTIYLLNSSRASIDRSRSISVT